MDTTPASLAGPTPSRPAADAKAATADAAEASTTAAADFETFLTLLTAQMRNQDPLQPMDSTEFVSQLASFSAVEQQIESNKRLDSLIDVVGGGAGAGLAQWIGKEVQVAAAIPFDDVPLELSVSPPEGARAASLVVRDAAGAVVGRVPADPAAQTLEWNGDLGDRSAAPGRYQFDVEYSDGEGAFETQAARAFARIEEVRLNGASATLVLEGGTEVGSEDVESIRAMSEVE